MQNFFSLICSLGDINISSYRIPFQNSYNPPTKQHLHPHLVNKKLYCRKKSKTDITQEYDTE